LCVCHRPFTFPAMRCVSQVKSIEERIAKLNEREQRNRLKGLQREKRFGGMNAYVRYLNQRKVESMGRAPGLGLGWQLYSPTINLTGADGSVIVVPDNASQTLLDLTRKTTLSLTIFVALARLGIVNAVNTGAPAADDRELCIHAAGANWSEGVPVEVRMLTSTAASVACCDGPPIGC